MAKQVKWNKAIYDEFVNLAMLSDIEQKILETRIKGFSIAMQMLEFNLSERTISRMINRMKKKYDDVQDKSTILPPRIQL